MACEGFLFDRPANTIPQPPLPVSPVLSKPLVRQPDVVRIKRTTIAGRVASIMAKAGKPLRVLDVLLTMAKLGDALVDKKNAMGIITSSMHARKDVFQRMPANTWAVRDGVVFEEDEDVDDVLLAFLTQPDADVGV